jgi:D-alanyl-D-alanine carboxypeptidase
MRRALVLVSLALPVLACGPQPESSAPTPVTAGDEALLRTGRGSPGDCASALEPLVTSAMASLGVPGAIVAVSVPGRCEWTATFGVRDTATGQPMQLPARVRVGSITKTFTGTAVLQLVDEGAVVLDHPVSEYVSGVPNGDAITVRQLLNMTSGLYNYSEDAAFNAALDADPTRVWTVDELLAIAYDSQENPYFAPGAGFHYSNTNSLLLGRIVEGITGNPLADELQRRIFRPLHMNATSLVAPGDASLPPPYARGYMFGTNVGTLLPGSCDAGAVPRDVTNASPSWTWAAGGAISNLRDLLIWARALALGTLLKPQTQAERLQWVDTGPPPAPQYGLHITNFAGILGHDGALPGYQSFMGYVPSMDATLVVLTNVFPDLTCNGPADVIARRIAALLQLIGG